MSLSAMSDDRGSDSPFSELAKSAPCISGKRFCSRAHSAATAASNARACLLNGKCRYIRRARIWVWGFLATPDAGFLLSGGYGYMKDDKLAKYAVHRYDQRERHRGSWHPAVDHDDWEVVRSTSGGAVALTRDGGLLVSDAVPFRITKYPDLEGNGGRTIIEDESVLSSAELDRAVTRAPGNTVSYTNAWSKSFFVGELPSGNILNVILEFPEDPDNPYTSLWGHRHPGRRHRSKNASLYGLSGLERHARRPLSRFLLGR